MPVWVIRIVVHFFGWLAALGFNIKPLGVHEHPFGTCMVTSVGMMGLDLVWAPFTPFAHTPIIVTVGAMKDEVVVVDGKPAVRPILYLNATVDHRYVDGGDMAVFAKIIRSTMEHPRLLDEGYTA